MSRWLQKKQTFLPYVIFGGAEWEEALSVPGPVIPSQVKSPPYLPQLLCFSSQVVVKQVREVYMSWQRQKVLAITIDYLMRKSNCSMDTQKPVGGDGGVI